MAASSPGPAVATSASSAGSAGSASSAGTAVPAGCADSGGCADAGGAVLRLLPAVDVANGLAVTHRTSAGGDAGVGISALDACLRWVEAGADWIHLVDLDAAFGRGSNAALLAQVIADLARLHPGVSVQWSGGVSSADDVERALAAGAKRVNLGAGVLKDLAATTALVGRFGRHLNVCLDVSAASAAPSPAAPADPAPSGAAQLAGAQRGAAQPATQPSPAAPADPAPSGAAQLAGAQRGAAQPATQPSADLATYVVHPRGQGGPVGPLEPILAALNEAGTGAYVVTDRVRDGALSGPNLPLLGTLSGATSAQVIASGGVSCAGDIAALQDLAASHPNLCGVILGKALYTGQIDLKAVLRP